MNHIRNVNDDSTTKNLRSVNILIFKTDIANRFHYSSAGEILQKIPGVLKWSVDMDDIDHVLRVEALGLQPIHIEQTLASAGYYCKELED